MRLRRASQFTVRNTVNVIPFEIMSAYTCPIYLPLWVDNSTLSDRKKALAACVNSLIPECANPSERFQRYL